MKLLSIVLLCFGLLQAEITQFDYSDYSKLLVQDAGRYKPLDSYARHMLLEFSGKTTVKIDGKKYSALDWFNMVIFNHPQVNSAPVFLINNPQVADAYGIERKSDRKYSFLDLAPVQVKVQQLAQTVMKIDSKNRTDIDHEFLRVYGLLQKIQDHNSAFTLAQKHPTFNIKDSKTAALLKLDTGMHSYLEILPQSSLLGTLVAETAKKDTAKWTVTDSTVSLFSYALYEWTEFYKQNQLAILPYTADKEYWLSPWAVIGNRLHISEPLATDLQLWASLYRSYSDNNKSDFEAQAQLLLGRERNQYPDIRYGAIDNEVIYNTWDFFYKAKLLYGLSLFLALVGLVSRPKLFNRASVLFLLGATIISVVGIGFRMYISQRPPVTNLFETFIFTGTVTALIGLLVEKYQKNGNGNLIGSFTALVLFLISGKYSSQGDTLGVLVAVLDSNFWLATHVITISLGYAGCVAAGVMGHVYLLQRLFGKAADELTKSYKTLFGILGFGLTLSFIGTVLGGIWADQSWGRFWGWDPKENGALLIVLWCAIIFHMRMAGWIKEFGVAVSSIIGIIMVMLAWFGINLLGVGLHSYGFTTGIAFNLMLYIILQLLFLVIVIPLIKRRERV